MKKIFALTVVLLVIIMFCGTVLARSGSAPNPGDKSPGEGPGPAPNSGDGIPDGSGMDHDGFPSEGPGPAPNSGDGVPDGSGF